MKKNIENYVIIGAPRSGTNMLRDVLSSLPGFCTWPCDEINYIWRYGNRNVDHDELDMNNCSDKSKRYINKQFKKISNYYEAGNVVEKTCANSLRVNFVESILENPRYINIVRDGRDAAASTMKRWCADFEPKYIFKKARYVPMVDFPYYALRYLNHRVSRVFSKEKSLSTWGPRFEGIDGLYNEKGLLHVCAEQWRQCVKKSNDELEKIDKSRVYSLRYEDFVSNPVEELESLLKYFKLEYDEEVVKSSVSRVSNRNVGKYKKDYSIEEIEIVEDIQRDQLVRFGYLEK